MSIVHAVLSLYVLVLFARIILSYFPITPGSPLVPVVNFLHAVTEPVLAPVRRILPPMSVGGMGLDLSPMIVLIIIYVLERTL